ncbi:MAG: heme ABC transporter ATP-binding protein [Pseudomonadota bacterium]
MISVENAVVRRGQRKTLNNVSLSLQRGEIIGIVGPNGAGKSTLLNVLAGALLPETGRVSIDGLALHDVSLASQARRRAVMGQHIDMVFTYFVHEIVSMGWEPFRTRQPLTNDRVERVAQDSGIADLLGRRFNELSGGERQRVQFARSCLQIDGIVSRGVGGYWLLDEPTASLDIGHELSVLRRLRVVARLGVGVCIVMHDLEQAARFCDRSVLLNHGQLIAVGAPREVLTDQRLSAVYQTPIKTEWHPTLERLLVHT